MLNYSSILTSSYFIIYWRTDGLLKVLTIIFLFLYHYMKTSGFHFAMHLFSNRSQKTSECGKNVCDD